MSQKSLISGCPTGTVVAVGDTIGWLVEESEDGVFMIESYGKYGRTVDIVTAHHAPRFFPDFPYACEKGLLMMNALETGGLDRAHGVLLDRIAKDDAFTEKLFATLSDPNSVRVVAAKLSVGCAFRLLRDEKAGHARDILLSKLSAERQALLVEEGKLDVGLVRDLIPKLPPSRRREFINKMMLRHMGDIAFVQGIVSEHLDELSDDIVNAVYKKHRIDLLIGKVTDPQVLLEVYGYKREDVLVRIRALMSEDALVGVIEGRCSDSALGTALVCLSRSRASDVTARVLNVRTLIIFKELVDIDITEREQLLEAYVSAMEKAREAGREKFSEFFASHNGQERYERTLHQLYSMLQTSRREFWSARISRASWNTPYPAERRH